MDISIEKINPAKKHGSNKNPDFLWGKKVRLKEKRKNKHDRRQSVRDGFFVSLSFKDDRRIGRDRRKTNPQSNS